MVSSVDRGWGGRAPQTANLAWDQVRKGNRLDRLDVPWAHSAFGDWVLDLTIMLARALAASHEKDIVHCDLKPSNILISAEGLPILVDFNVAFRRSATASPGNVGGTLPYMAPEQIRAFAGDGFSDISGQTDIYGLGATIYELLTGKMPFGEITSADDGVRPLLQLRRDGAAPIRKLNRDVDPEFATLLDNCLNYEISDRPATAELLADQLEKIRDRRRTRRPITGTAIRAALVTAAAAIVAAATYFSMETSEAAHTGQNQLAATVRASSIKHVAPRRQEDIVAELVETAYDAFEVGDFDVANERFKKASALDVEHEAAVLGQIRCCIHLGKPAVAARLVQNWTSARTMESMALRAYFSGLDGSWDVATDAFSKARAAGIDTPAIRANLAYALLKQRRFDDAQEVAEELLRDSGNDTGATLTQVQAYLMQQQDHETAAKKALMVQKKRPVTDPLDFYDANHVEFLIESAPEGPARAFVAGMVYPDLSTKLKDAAPEVSRRLLDLAMNEFDQGVQLGHDRAHWNAMKLVLDGCLPGYVADSTLAQKYANVPVNPNAPLVTPLFLSDPISGSRLDRWTGRHLNDFIEAADPALVATK